MSHMSEKDAIVRQEQLEKSSVDDLFGESVTDLNATIHEDGLSKANFMIAVDATGSMSSYWSLAKDVLIRALDEIRSRTSTPFRINMVAYRDECDGPAIIEASGIESNLVKLQDFIRGVRCHGGGDYPEAVYEALRLGLQFPYGRIIVLGDAPSQPQRPGYDEATTLGQQQCPVFTLRLHDDAQLTTNFERIAKLSGGKSFLLSGDPTEAVDVIATILSRDKRLLKGSPLGITYQPQTEKAKEVAQQL